MKSLPTGPATRAQGMRQLLRAAFVAAILFLLLPQTALAKSYHMTRVDINATVAPDGSLALRETRTFSFDGSFNGVYWKIPIGTYKGREIGLAIDEVSVTDAGGQKTLQHTDTDQDNTYQVTTDEGITQIKIFSAHANEDVDFTLAYTYTNLASRWQDTAELYWKFVSDGWDMQSQNVTCRIHLPIPEGTIIEAGKNVRVWGHGPLAGHAAVEGQDVVYTLPEVGTSEFAEARIVFPAEWLSAVEPADEAHLDAILAEEQAWADEANATRKTQHGRRVRNCATMGIVAAATALYAALRKRRHDRLHKDAFGGTYFRDMPSNDHPVVLASLLAFREQEDRDAIARMLAGQTANGMPASLMRLASDGVIALEKAIDLAGKPTYRLVETGRVGRSHNRDAQDVASKKIDHATLSLLFDVVGNQPKGNDAGAQRSVLMSDFEKAATERTSAYEKGWAAWGEAVADAYAERGFKTEVDTTATIPVILAVVDGLVAIGMGFVAFVNGVSIPLIIAFAAALVAAGVCCIKVELATMYLHTPEAYDLMGKTEALKSWLLDFTRLKEAIPTDVVLWNQLLVMATALGISKEVLKQLKAKVPQLMANPAFTAYGWYRRDRDDDLRESPMSSLTKSCSAASAITYPKHEYSSSSYNTSDRSSGRGSGGGFSGGGGGGFGGGGGGGAF